MIKMLIKELITINHIDRFLFNLAPYIVIISSVLAFGCLPFAKGFEVLDFNVGIFFLMAVSSIGIVGILLAGWSSNNKYSLIGAMRSGAQMISYELSIGLSLMTMVVFAGKMCIRDRSKPQTMEISMPTKDTQEDMQTKVAASRAITLLLGEDDKVYYYLGEPNYQDYTCLLYTSEYSMIT